MRFPQAASFLAAAFAVRSTDAFSGSSWVPQKQSVGMQRMSFVSTSRLNMAGDDDDDDGDDWFSDYNPEEFESPSSKTGYREDNSSYGGRSRRSSNYSSVGHDYERDTSRDSSNIDEDVINELLSERLKARKVGDFETADSIRDVLMNDHCVAVFDREKTWRTGVSASFRKPTGRRAPRRKQQNFGPNGHDYEYAYNAGPITSSVSESDIHALLAERLQSKLNRDFKTADAIQYNLAEEGVYIDDGSKEWRADGVPFRDSRGAGQSRKDRNRKYSQSEHSSTLDQDDHAMIQELVEERRKCKEFRDYLNADSIREDLKSRFDVYVDDRLREWSVGGNFGETHNQARQMSETMRSRPYAKSLQSSPDVSPEIEEYIQSKVDERAEAKRVRDFDVADEIRDSLKDQYDVVIQDKIKMWSVGGDFGDAGPRKRKAPGEYTRRGGGKLSEEDIQTISDIVAQRYQAKRDRDYELADGLRDELRETFQVSIDDRNREWNVDSDDYAQTESELGARELSPEEVAEVQSKLEQRSVLKRERNYDAADAIRDDLMAEYSVKIDDRTKEWAVVMGVGNYKFDQERRQTDRGLDGDQDSVLEAVDSIDDDLDAALDSVFESATPDESESEETASYSDIPSISIDDSDGASTEDLSKLTVVQLKEKLRESGQPVSGKKDELISRLLGV